MIRPTSLLNTALLIAGLCILANCGGETGTNPRIVPGPDPDSSDSTTCSGTVNIIASNGTTPAFSWTPDCAIGRLIVEDGINEMWGTETAGTNVYRSPIVYDVAPPNAVEPEPAIPLVPGTTYTVSLFTWFSTTPESLLLVGSTTFTP